MNFLADEGVDRQIVDRLRLDGHRVAYVAEISPGIADEVVLAESRNSASAIREHAEELPGAFAVLTVGSIRIRRRLPT